MRTLIIPDIHHRWEKAESIIKNESADRIIFLGDYFDSFDEDLQAVQETADWLLYSIRQNNRIHLIGNHDLHYISPLRIVQCAGYQDWKYFAINDIIDKKYFKELRWFYNLDDKWLLTHAGLHDLFVPKHLLTSNRNENFANIETWLKQSVSEIKKSLINGSGHPLISVGHKRGGLHRVGGIIWCDIYEFKPVSGINQIFGHTYQDLPLLISKTEYISYHCQPIEIDIVKPYSYVISVDEDYVLNGNNSFNINLDTATNYYAIWDGCLLEIKYLKELKL